MKEPHAKCIVLTCGQHQLGQDEALGLTATACLGIPAPGSTGQNKARRILGDSKSVSRFAAFLLHGHAW